MRTRFLLAALCVLFAIPAYSQIVIQPYDHYDPGSFLDYRWGHIYDGYRRLHTQDVIDYLGYTTYGSEYMRAKSNVQWGFSLTAGGAVAVIFGASVLSVVQDSNRFTEEQGHEYADLLGARHCPDGCRSRLSRGRHPALGAWQSADAVHGR
jgi:hypothetical protein